MLCDAPSTFATNIIRDIVYHYPELSTEIGLQEDMLFLGEGGFGAVYALDEYRAIKITRHQGEAQKARAIMKKRIPYVVDIHRVITLREDRHIIIMERLNKLPEWAGEALKKCKRVDCMSIDKIRQTRQKNKDLTPPERRFFRQLDTGYIKLTQHDVYHNDIHDGNILVSRRGNFKIIDVM